MEYMNLNDNRRYSGLLVSIGLLIAFITALLIFAIYASNTLRKDATLINESNRIDTAAQTVIKDLFDLQNSYGESPRAPHLRTVHKRLKENTAFISDAITVLETGGSLVESGESYDVPALSLNAALSDLSHAKQQWQMLKPRIDAYLAQSDNPTYDSSNDLQQAVEQAKTSSLLMSNSLERLSAEVFADAQRQAAILRWVQITGIATLMLYLLWFVSYFMRRLKESDAQTLAAQRETAEIMQTVDTGLFLLDRDLTVGSQHSTALIDIIGTDRVAGRSLEEILRNRISDKDLQTAEEFIGQLYNPRVKEKLIHDLNPLHKIMVHDVDKGSRYLDFKFSRVYDDSEISRILVNVNDVSEAVKLEQRLEKEKAQNDRQIEMLTTILNVSPRVIGEFIDNTANRIEKMNNILKNPGSSQFELENKLRSIYREMHALKGEASALKLHSFIKIAAEAEDKLHLLQNQGKLSGNDFLPLTVQLDELLNLSNIIATLGERINGVGNQTGQVASETTDRANQASQSSVAPTTKAIDAKEFLGDYLVDFGKNIAERQGKKIQVDVSRMAGVILPDRLSGVIKEICVQLLRNAIVHGIADTQTRIHNGKNPMGKVTISFQDKVGERQNDIMFVVEDDGQGIDYDAIRQKLMDSGRYPVDKVSAFSHAQLLNILFSSGFSTKTTADEDGGRGVGLDIVKDRVKEYGGKINVQSEKGKFSRFVVKLPMS